MQRGLVGSEMCIRDRPYSYPRMTGAEFGRPSDRVLSKAAQAIITMKEQDFAKMTEERRQAEMDLYKKRRKINEERIKNLPRFVTTFARKDAFKPVEFDQYF
eukprot:TRINITY_DN10825_c0_g1_i4.p2 TRINITY_DN10825_c0_g1~~TRINITY_DN10825_c0_g1_i4.p2  ORF type:complete len:102 (-),score=26.33 TRINITY_DN10825_c0_g1_i4:18-323(-)